MTARVRSLIRRRPTVAFFCLAFASSWTLMTPAMVAGLDSSAAIPFFLGMWAPAGSAAIVVRVTGGSVKGWLRHMMRWRVPAMARAPRRATQADARAYAPVCSRAETVA